MNGYALLDGPVLSRRTTMGIGGTALAEVRVTDARALAEAMDTAQSLAREEGGRIAVLGLGSNLLVREGCLPLVVASLDLGGTVCKREEDACVLLRVGADTRLALLLSRAASWGLSGLEALAGIPGSVGGALVMNAGSYGACMGDVVRSIQVFTPGKGLREVAAGKCVFAYRQCRPADEEIRGDVLVTEVEVSLTRDDPARIRSRMWETLCKKRAGQPVAAKSAGCVFKNPHPDHPAGRLLEEAGFRGKQIGDLQFSPKHANFLVNIGKGTCGQAEELIAMAREAVRRHSGFDLELEVRVWP